MSDVTEQIEPGYGAPRVVLVGESNPYGADPRFALYPLPPNASGGRLARILGLSAREYLRAFPRRVDLLTGSHWAAPSARLRAAELCDSLPNGSGVILLGARVSAAFGFEYTSAVFAVREKPCARTLYACVIPHPSGLNRVWSSDPLAATRARDAVRLLCEKVRNGRGERC